VYTVIIKIAIKKANKKIFVTVSIFFYRELDFFFLNNLSILNQTLQMKIILFLSFFSSVLSQNLSLIIDQVWQGFVERNNGNPFLIHRPFSETPGDAVSEGVGYGLILAMYSNDQYNFNRLLQGAEQTMWNGQCYDWRIDQYNQKMSFGGATDAEQDIIAMLIMANSRVLRNEWTNYENGFYASRAQVMLDNFWSQGITWDLILRPGYQWGGENFVNVGYFAPAWYRIFNDFDSHKERNWLGVVEKSYEILEKSPGYPLVPDWMTPNGEYTSGLGYNTYGDGRYMYKDAIRTLWRIGTDYLWYNETRALNYMCRAFNFLEINHNGIYGANFFQMDGYLIPENDVWYFDNGQKQRPRQEHSPLTIGMWVIPIQICGNDYQKSLAIHEMSCYHQENKLYWGLDNNPWNPQEDVYHNELYFEQFLASFGALILTERFFNFFVK